MFSLHGKSLGFKINGFTVPGSTVPIDFRSRLKIDGLRPDPSIFDLDSRHARAHTYHFSIVYIHLNNILITLPTYEEDSCRHTALRLSVRFYYYFFPSRSSREGMSFYHDEFARASRKRTSFFHSPPLFFSRILILWLVTPQTHANMRR